MLDNRFSDEDAAMALALMGAVEFTPHIAALLKSKDSLARASALLALGVLKARAHRDKVATHLSDPTEYVRDYAAWALVMMEDDRHADRVLEVLRQSSKEGIIALRMGNFHFIVHNQFRAIKSRAERFRASLEVRNSRR